LPVSDPWPFPSTASSSWLRVSTRFVRPKLLHVSKGVEHG
jgi:hypothetical protein